MQRISAIPLFCHINHRQLKMLFSKEHCFRQFFFPDSKCHRLSCDRQPAIHSSIPLPYHHSDKIWWGKMIKKGTCPLCSLLIQPDRKTFFLQIQYQISRPDHSINVFFLKSCRDYPLFRKFFQRQHSAFIPPAQRVTLSIPVHSLHPVARTSLIPLQDQPHKFFL